MCKILFFRLSTSPFRHPLNPHDLTEREIFEDFHKHIIWQDINRTLVIILFHEFRTLLEETGHSMDKWLTFIAKPPAIRMSNLKN